MTDRGYGAINDPYCYEGSTVLKNKLNIRDQERLAAAERQLTGLRFDEALPSGAFDVSHYCAIHNHLFQDIFAWAGEFRTVRISKGASMFCYPEFIAPEMQTLFIQLKSNIIAASLDRQEFANRAAIFLADLNAIHPFREGNGRTQLAFLTILSEQAGHPLNLQTFNPERLLAAMIASFNGDVTALAAEIMGEEY
jgi:cell filamentation protein